jgi:hypothetical protein
MLLRCPHCNRIRDHVRSDFYGDWVVCPACELPFAWYESRAKENGHPRPGIGPALSVGSRGVTREES